MKVNLIKYFAGMTMFYVAVSMAGAAPLFDMLSPIDGATYNGTIQFEYQANSDVGLKTVWFGRDDDSPFWTINYGCLSSSTVCDKETTFSDHKALPITFEQIGFRHFLYHAVDLNDEEDSGEVIVYNAGSDGDAVSTTTDNTKVVIKLKGEEDRVPLQQPINDDDKHVMKATGHERKGIMPDYIRRVDDAAYRVKQQIQNFLKSVKYEH